MTTQMIFFTVLALIAIIGAVMMMLLTTISHRVVSMAFSFFAVSGMYFLLGADFIGIIQIMVYVGAITILFIFGMMMTDHKTVSFEKDFRTAHNALGTVASVTLLGILLYGIFSMDLPGNTQPEVTSIHSIGMSLYGHYFVAFIAVAFLLTSALIGAIVIARKEAN
ncbi:NADH-quinone oxidoreductase subunit J [Salisediminibacterium beveridgei]|uniref:NADH-quinone oxidoreductase subunit J n=1 Tax=Salisediminibacterium beveridgei TaxID=632773 RepID=A0A1D7QRG7_9BACI|nr:NADH-quinone oxidoreductase subunit J [Salisediminibacterium beveridgei]AOM81598.1 NADH-ubiquinone oxidoreductase chain J [Salisediminibacterium beveridgei]